jgi:hypothetical protein
MESPNPEDVWTCSPGLCRCPNGRLVATGGFRGPGIDRIPGIKCGSHQGRIFVSDDHGKSWTQTAEFPFLHARPFVAGGKLYVLGHDGDLMVMASNDWGQTWSESVKLTEGQKWHQAPCNVLYANGCVYLVMERSVYDDCKSWEPSVLAPVLIRAQVDSDLTKPENWTFASELAFRDAFSDAELIGHGDVFYPILPKETYFPAPGRDCAPPGWLETNIFKIHDPDHYWFDSEQKTIHLIARLHNGWTGYAALLTVTEQGDQPGTGAMVTGFQKLPAGGECRFLPLPGGQMKFHVLYDEVTSLYWLLSTQATDSMTRADKLPADRYNLPNNQRTRLVLHFSTNMVDWCFAGLVAAEKSEVESRHYASMAIDGDDLCVLSRSGDRRAASAHNGNLVTFHKVKNFRELVY